MSPLLRRLEQRTRLMMLLVHVLAVVSLRGHHLRLKLNHVAALLVLMRQEIGALHVPLVGRSEVVH